MSDTPNAAKGLRDRLGGNTEDRLGKALSELLESPLLTGAIGRAFDAREKASQAQEVAMGALNLPSAADIERLTRRLRSVSHRLEGIEDGVDRLDRALAPSGVEARLTAIEAQLSSLADKLEQALSRQTAPAPAVTSAPRAAGSRSAPAGGKSPRRGGGTARTTAKQARAKQVRAAKEAKAAKGGSGKTAKPARGAGARGRAGRSTGPKG